MRQFLFFQPTNRLPGGNRVWLRESEAGQAPTSLPEFSILYSLACFNCKYFFLLLRVCLQAIFVSFRSFLWIRLNLPIEKSTNHIKFWYRKNLNSLNLGKVKKQLTFDGIKLLFIINIQIFFFILDKCYKPVIIKVSCTMTKDIHQLFVTDLRLYRHETLLIQHVTYSGVFNN